MSNGPPGTAFDFDLVEDRPGMMVLRVSGKGAFKAFEHESGGHRWQRTPPTEKQGRVHSSTITVAVMAVPTQSSFKLDDRDLEWKTCRGSGAGGQHRNVTDSAVQVTHLPSGLQVRAENERSQHQNREVALELLRARLADAAASKAETERNALRKGVIGTGMRGDKGRTVQVQNDKVIDHRTGKVMRVREYLKGDLSGLLGL